MLNPPSPFSSINSGKQNPEFPRQRPSGAVKLWALVLSGEQHAATSEDAHHTPPSHRWPWLRNALRGPWSGSLKPQAEATLFQLRSPQ